MYSVVSLVVPRTEEQISSPISSKKSQMTLNKWMGRPQLLPEIFEIVLRPIWWVAGKEQQSPPSSAAEGQRLTEAISVAQVVLQYLLA